ncbi:MAG: biotin/lipoyl-binding protein [Planctomycetia bacterium]|jgi:biotin carboxyl carrier protein|nr:biotin/lipoyl-binding protein [Planctomycetia bacterium]NCF99909.1 biotin/lipoyl-binding protein [Planctomycetia bacterium]NCG11986.1 biotin/lipoyl-binding protein [Planctomycetia bacterium]NCG56198.1 biotin/lipoyl-binding protein [Pseudomonadota bacterium]
MPGIVRKILVQEGDSVEAGQPLLLLEAMKMENEILAPEGGTVTRLHVSAGDTVAAGTIMAHIEKDD